MRLLWTIIFGFWAFAGFVLNGIQIALAYSRYEIGVGTSAAVTMDIAFWIAGLLIFGFAAVLCMDEAPPVASASEPDYENMPPYEQGQTFPKP